MGVNVKGQPRIALRQGNRVWRGVTYASEGLAYWRTRRGFLIHVARYLEYFNDGDDQPRRLCARWECGNSAQRPIAVTPGWHSDLEWCEPCGGEFLIPSDDEA